MEPTLHEGDRLLVLYGARPRPGKLAIVVLPHDSSGAARPLAVKRLVRPEPDSSGEAGGTGETDRSGDAGGMGDVGDPGGWWVERDNPREGVDSWAVGAIPTEGILARVLWRLPSMRVPVLRIRIGRRGK